MTAAPIIRAVDIEVSFTSGFGRNRRTISALNGVSLDVGTGEIVGLVGESGSGKSTMARVMTGLQRQTRGTLEFEGVPIPARRGKELYRSIQMVFQDPYSSLDPRMTVRQTLVEMLDAHSIVTKSGRAKRCDELMDLVQLPNRILDSRPGGMSGGQRQRIAIARALTVNPRLLIADEAVSALDVSIQAGIINLLSDLRAELGLSMLFISHDLAIVRSLCDRVAVIYNGDIVEEQSSADLFANPREEYTKRLLGAVPRLHAGRG
jgi:peptide/nickel transport system ATP-binding protein